MTAAKGPTPVVTIVTYHFVRPVSATPFPRLAALEVGAFREQLRYLRRFYSPVRLADVVAPNAAATLPPRPLVLTFDDGYRDHYVQVLPLLAEHGIPAIFFPVRSALVDRCVLDANKVQFMLAAVADSAAIVGAIDQAIETSRDPAVATVAEYRGRWWLPTRFDDASVGYVKRMLQYGLPQTIRQALVDSLFARYVTGDEVAFAAELYLTVGEAREMLAAGMDFGGHGDRHVPMTALAPEEQAREIEGALQSLDAIGVSRRMFAYSYVKGEHDATSRKLLRTRGCAVALTTREDLATIGLDDPLTLPRIDTIRLPVDGDAPPNAWTQKVLV